MNFLDLRTILVSYVLCNLVCAIVLFSLWKQNRSRFAGLDLVMVSFTVNLLGILLFALRNIAPDFLSLLAGNIFLVAGVLLLFIGVARFLDRHINQTHNYIFFFVYVVLQAWFIYGNPNLQYRMILFSAVISIYCVQMTWMLFSNKEKQYLMITKSLGVISIVYWLIGIIRIAYELIAPSRIDLFQATPLETLIYLVFQLVYIILTFYLFILVNRRLVFVLEEDLDLRKQVEAELELSHEKYQKSYQASPNSILITRMSDGKIIEANEQFMTLFGYSRDEVMASSTLALKIWANPLERKKIVTLIKNYGRIKEYEIKGCLKSGEILTFLFSGEILFINNELCMLTYLQDVTKRKQTESILKFRLTLWEYATTHSSLELMQKVLDEIELLTHSQIGFFHIMDQMSNSLTLQAWSTRTKNEFCKAEGEGMHYPVESAGVWCDSVREKKSIIHNDYSSLPNRKGMPEGHATVTRELVVPILRDNHVLAVIGIGNKESNYDPKDVELVEMVANLAWDIIVENQAEEKIQQLNQQLEKLAMVDELTGLANRRSFFIKGNEEISQAKRYKTPLSLIMLDLDKFKKINDTFGHNFGDNALKCAAQILSDCIREVDIVGRLGGEEFAILLPHTEIEKAALLAERLRQAIEDQSCIKMNKKVTLTASFGIAEYDDELLSFDDLLKKADKAMYEAKASGRNRVV